MKLTYGVIMIACAVFFLLAGNVDATETPSGLRFACLAMQYCRQGVAGNEICSTQNSHRVRLTPGTSKGILDDQNTYLTECIQIDENGDGIAESICTTGSAALDQELFCNNEPNCTNDNLARLQNNPSLKYTLHHTSQGGIYFSNGGIMAKQDGPKKIATDANGNIIPAVIEWQSHTETKAVRRFLIWNKIAVPTPQSGNEPTHAPGGIGGQQQGTLTFPFQDGNTAPSADCAGLAWDPYGRAFDAATLEPIPDAKIVLEQQNPATGMFEQEYANQSNPNIDNPDLTGKDGLFSFVVTDGTYTLTPSHPSYTHAAGTPEAFAANHPNSTKIYSNLYFAPESGTPQSIQQQGKIQQRDIPMQPLNGTGFRYPLALLDSFETLTDFSLNGTASTLVFGGTISHPFADLKVEICSQSTGTEVCRNSLIYNQANGGPDAHGNFSIKLAQGDLKPGEYFKKSFIASDLTKKYLSKNLLNVLMHSLLSMLEIPSVSAQEAGRTITIYSAPIVRYLEGFAYDQNGQRMPGTRVGLYTKYSPQPVYVTYADTNGYFKITSEFIPAASYTIRYTNPDSSHAVELQTSQFLEENKEFISSERINVYMNTTREADPRKNTLPVSTAPLTVSPPLGIRIVDIEIPKKNNTATPVMIEPKNNTQSQVQRNNNSLLLLGISLLVISTVGAVGVFFVLKKQT